MKEYKRIKNHGQICEVMGTNGFGGVVLKNPNYGRNEIFNKNAVEAVPHGQYIYCHNCDAPILIKTPDYYPWLVCSLSCKQEQREHYA